MQFACTLNESDSNQARYQIDTTLLGNPAKDHSTSKLALPRISIMYTTWLDLEYLRGIYPFDNSTNTITCVKRGPLTLSGCSHQQSAFWVGSTPLVTHLWIATSPGSLQDRRHSKVMLFSTSCMVKTCHSQHGICCYRCCVVQLLRDSSFSPSKCHLKSLQLVFFKSKSGSGMSKVPEKPMSKCSYGCSCMKWQ